MNITRVTLQWYRQRLQPKWASAFCKKEQKVSIDAVINSQAGDFDKARDKDFVAHNLISICRMARKRRCLYKYLREVQNDAGTVVRPDQRSALARKWADRLLKVNRGKWFILAFVKVAKDGSENTFILGDPSKPMTYPEVCSFRDAHNQYRTDGHYEFLEIDPNNYE